MENNIELMIENTGKFYNNADSWYQAWITIGGFKQEIGRSFYDYNDCRLNCENIVKEFARQGIQVIHDKIYDLAP